MTRNAYNPAIEERHEFPKLKADHDEDPARFLQSGKKLALARISGIRDEELLEAYRAVAKQILTGSSRSEVLEELDSRKCELTDDAEPTPEPETTTDPVPATDGGTTLKYDESDTTENTVTIHPDAKGLEAGQVLVVDRGEKTEYVFPTTDVHDAPFLSRAYDTVTGDLWMELEIDGDDYRKRLAHDHEFATLEEIAYDAPRTAATGGDQ